MITATTMLVALLLEAALGWPDRLFARIGHPVTWLGHLIAFCDARFNREEAPSRARRLAGAVVALGVIGCAALAGGAVATLLPSGWPGIILGGLAASPLLAARSLHDHVAAVALPLSAGRLDEARAAVAKIVGRDPNLLDQAGVARAAMESLAENASDGVIAPLFWGGVFGLPGIAAYKAINTLDSMIGHRTPRHEAFGWAAARMDDVANLVPARLTGLLFALASGRSGTALRTMLRDARHHRSPNAGWPEAAMAGALGVRLSGPRRYAGRVAEEPWLNGAAPDPRPDDLAAGLRLYLRAMAGAAFLLLAPLLWHFA